jgi:hypothetical protein
MATDLEVSSTTESDVEDISSFLRATFQADANWLPFQPAMVRWKSVIPHPLWNGSRGYALRRRGEIVAHGCAVPTQFVYSGGAMLTACIVDWAASKTTPGTGVMIYQHIGKLTDGLIGVGGSDDAQKVLPRLGFKPRQTLETYSKVTKPLAAFSRAQEKTWKDAARFGRDVLRLATPVKGDASGWSAERIDRFDERAVFPRPDVISATVCYRDPQILNYFLLCPVARMEAYLLRKAGKLIGYFLLAFLRGECRIAELWIDSPEADDWAAAYLVAAEGRSVTRVSVACGTAVQQTAAQRAGFYLTSRQPVYVKDPRSLLPAQFDAALGLLDTDAFYL